MTPGTSVHSKSYLRGYLLAAEALNRLAGPEARRAKVEELLELCDNYERVTPEWLANRKTAMDRNDGRRAAALRCRALEYGPIQTTPEDSADA